MTIGTSDRCRYRELVGKRSFGLIIGTIVGVPIGFGIALGIALGLTFNR